MHFVILSQYYKPESNSPAVRLPILARELIKNCHSVEVVTALPNYPIGKIFEGYQKRIYMKEEMDGVNVHRVWIYPALGTGIKRILNYLSFVVFMLFGLFQTKKADYLFINSPPLLLGLTGYFYARICHTPIIFHVADLWPDFPVNAGILRNPIIIVTIQAICAKKSVKNLIKFQNA